MKIVCDIKKQSILNEACFGKPANGIAIRNSTALGER